MKDEQLMDILRKEIEIPDIVTEKADQALDQIRREVREQEPMAFSGRRAKGAGKKYAVLAAVAALAAGTVSVYAAYSSWSRGMQEELHVSEEQQRKLEENGMTSFAASAAVDAGVTITAQQSITDHYYSYLAFQVDGYQLEEGETPAFENVTVTVDGETEVSWGGHFYDGIVDGEEGTLVYGDGTSLDTDSDGVLIPRYVGEDGSMEYHIVLARSMERGFFTGKRVQVEFENLGTVTKDSYQPDIQGRWLLEMELGGADTSRLINTKETLGDTDAVVTSVELSPVSIRVLYDFPRKLLTEEFEDEDGRLQSYTYSAEPPMAVGVRLKDGTCLAPLYGGPGTQGYLDTSSEQYVLAYAFAQVIDPDQAAAILFEKLEEDGGTGYENLQGDETTSYEEPDYYEIAVK